MHMQKLICIHIERARQVDRLIYGHKDKQMTDRQAERQIDRKNDRQTDRWMQVDQIDRWIHTDTHRNANSMEIDMHIDVANNIEIDTDMKIHQKRFCLRNRENFNPERATFFPRSQSDAKPTPNPP